MHEWVGVNDDEADRWQVEEIRRSGHGYGTVVGVRERMFPDGRESFVDPFGVLMIARADDDGCAVKGAVGPFADEHLVVIVLSSVEPITDLGDGIDMRYTCGEGVVVGTLESAMDIAEDQNGPDRIACRLLENVVEGVACPMGFSGHAEPRLPADDTEDCSARKQECANYDRDPLTHQKGRSLVPSPAEALKGSGTTGCC